MGILVTKEVSKDELDLLMETNMGLVVKLAKTFGPRNDEEYEEFVQLGRIGLWKAIIKHDPSRSKLSTTAWHYIRYEILRHISKRSKLDVQLDETLPVEDVRPNLINSVWECLPHSLSDKEMEVINLRLCGYTFLSIGSQMGYSRGWANDTFKKAIYKIKNANL